MKPADRQANLRDMVDAIRHVLGLDPLYRNPRLTEAERFHVEPMREGSVDGRRRAPVKTW